MTTDQLSALLAQDPAAVLEHDRRLYEQQIVRAADLIAAHAQERPAVLLAGPSGSGKTTTALLIERELDRRGMETHTLSMDDYFCPLTERELELFSRNELDLERPSRVDVPFSRSSSASCWRARRWSCRAMTSKTASVSSMAAHCAGGPVSWSFWRASTP